MYLFTPHYDETTGRYCGPTAMCALTGERLSIVKAAIRQASGKILDAAGRAHRVGGVSNTHLIDAMRLLGWTVAENEESIRPRAERFCDFLRLKGSNGPYIVNVTDHYIAVGWGEIADPFNPLCVDIDRYLARPWRRGAKGRYQNAWMHRWWQFEKSENRLPSSCGP